MSISITVQDANAYFAPTNHTRFALWAKFDESQKVAALAHAGRVISKAISKEVSSESVVEGSFYYPDRAVFEQALFMLLTSEALPNAEQTAPRFYAHSHSSQDGLRKQEEIRSPEELCAAAASYLNRPKRQLYIARG